MIKIITLENFSLSEITPDNIKNDTEIKALIPALDEEIKQITQAMQDLYILPAIDNLEAPVLDFLAVQFHVDFYDLAANVKTKREFIKNSLTWHMKKGTRAAILEALKMIGIDGEFLHWHDTGDEPYTFRINAEITGDYHKLDGKDKIIWAIRRAIEESKAARSFMNSLKVFIKADEQINLYAGQASLISGHDIIRPYRDKDFPQDNLYADTLYLETHSDYLGLDNALEQIILDRYEERICKRLEAMLAAVDMKLELSHKHTEKLLEQHTELITEKVNEITDLLRWKGEDDEL